MTGITRSRGKTCAPNVDQVDQVDEGVDGVACLGVHLVHVVHFVHDAGHAAAGQTSINGGY